MWVRNYSEKQMSKDTEPEVAKPFWDFVISNIKQQAKWKTN